MHVLHVISGIDRRDGGPVHALLGLTSEQRRAGLGVRVVTSMRAGDDLSVGEEMRANGVEVIAVGPTRGALRRHPDLAPTLRRSLDGVDVCHVHAIWGEIQHRAAVECRRLGVPYVMRTCGMLDPWCLAVSRLRKRLYMAWRLRRDLDGAAAIHFTTATERDLTKPLGLRAPAIVEPNGVDLAEFEDLPVKGAFRARHADAVRDRPIVLFLSRVHPKKGLDLLIPAFARAKRGDAILVIVGPDYEGYQAELEALAARSGLARADYVFTGMLRGRDRIEALVDAEFFVLPSYQENFGVAVVEALAAGCPVVISDQVNIHDEITTARVGAVVPTAIDPLAAEIERWLADPVLRRDASARAAPFVRDRFDWAAIARRWPVHYERMCAAANGRAVSVQTVRRTS